MALASSVLSFPFHPTYQMASDTERQAQKNEVVVLLNERRRIALAAIDEVAFS